MNNGTGDSTFVDSQTSTDVLDVHKNLNDESSLELEQDIRNTRAEIYSTVQELGDKLSPDVLATQVRRSPLYHSAIRHKSSLLAFGGVLAYLVAKQQIEKVANWSRNLESPTPSTIALFGGATAILGYEFFRDANGPERLREAAVGARQRIGSKIDEVKSRMQTDDTGRSTGVTGIYSRGRDLYTRSPQVVGLGLLGLGLGASLLAVIASRRKSGTTENWRGERYGRDSHVDVVASRGTLEASEADLPSVYEVELESNIETATRDDLPSY